MPTHNYPKNSDSFRKVPSFLSSAGLLMEMRQMIDASLPLVILYEANSTWPKVIMFCEELEAHDEIMKSLTALHSRSQMEFERAMFCAWLSLHVALELKLSLEYQRALFFAGLVQDIGKTVSSQTIKFLPSKPTMPACASQYKNSKLECVNEDNHALISSVHIESSLNEIEGLNDLVLYHHAKDDGTGYPRKVSESQLSVPCQILIVANEMAERSERMGGYNELAAVLPTLRLASLLYFPQVHRAWLAVLAPLTRSEIGDGPSSPNIRLMQAQCNGLQKLIAHLLQVSAELLPYDFDLTIHAARTSIHKLTKIFVDTGVLNESIDVQCEKLPHEIRAEIFMVLQGIVDFVANCREDIHTVLNKKTFDFNKALLADGLVLLDQSYAQLNGQEVKFSMCR